MRRQTVSACKVIDRAIDQLGKGELEALASDWSFWAREKQLPPPGTWRVWLLMAGRGFGKTRTGAEWICQLAAAHAGAQIGLVGASFDDVRHVMIEGPSGVLSVCDATRRPVYFPSRHQLVWTNGTKARLFAADKPSQLRGPEFHFAWADEIAKWRYEEAWHNLMMCLRIGTVPRALATTTPRPLPWLSKLARAADTVLVTGKTDDNRANLAPEFLTAMHQAYGQSAMARQELGGELLEEVPGALWQRDALEALVTTPPARGQFARIVVGVDPAIGGANETGHRAQEIAQMFQDCE